MTASGRAAVERAGRSVFPAFELHALARVSSTQDAVREAADAGAPAGYCVLAEEQDAGRGRQGRAWRAAPGSALLASLLLRERAEVAPGVSLATGLAVRATVAGLGVDARVKWPNDVLAGDRKLAGILCEVTPRSAGHGVAIAVGIGLNLSAPPAEVPNATDLVREAATAPGAAGVLARLLPELGARMEVLRLGGIPALREEWMRSAYGLGEMVTATTGGSMLRGTAIGLADDGALLVRDGATTHRLVAGDVHLVRAADDGGEDQATA